MNIATFKFDLNNHRKLHTDLEKHVNLKKKLFELKNIIKIFKRTAYNTSVFFI